MTVVAKIMIATTKGDVAKYERGACITTRCFENLTINDEGDCLIQNS